jgi:hypothetical protein
MKKKLKKTNHRIIRRSAVAGTLIISAAAQTKRAKKESEPLAHVGTSSGTYTVESI